MNDLVIRRLNPEDETAFYGAIRTFAGPGYQPGQTVEHWVVPAVGRSFCQFVQGLLDSEAGKDLAPGRVPDTNLFAFVGQECIGRVGIRHELNDFLMNYGGHIGYAVVPGWRGKGVAKALLQAGLRECKRRGISRALLTCADDNVASIRTIEGAGGVLENKVPVPNVAEMRRRYWVPVT